MSDRPRSSRSPTVVTRRLAAAIVAVISALALLAGCSGPTSSATVTVNGRVIDFFAPIANASVLVDGMVTTTAADGTFTVAGVHTPYDVTVSFQSSTDVWIYQGLTRPDPTIQIFGTSTTYSATVSGTIGTAAYQSGEVGAAFPAGTSLSYGGASVQTGTTTFGPGTITWGPDDPLHTTLYALRALADGNGNPTSYTEFGSLAVTLHNGDTLTGLAIPATAAAVSTASMSGTISVPTGFTLQGANAVIRLGPASGGSLVGLPLVNLNLTSGTFSNTMLPKGTDISAGLAAGASGPAGAESMAWSPVTVPNAAASLTVPSPAQLTAPAPNATNVGPGTTFSSTALPDSIYVFALSPGSGVTGPSVYIVTASASTALPDLSAINRALPANSAYTVGVEAVGSYTSMRAATDPDGLFSKEGDLEIISFGGGGSGPAGISGPDQSAWFTVSPWTDIKTAP